MIDGARQDNRGEINTLDEEMEYDCIYWVASQQVTIPEEQLQELGWTEFKCSSWSSGEIDAYGATFDDSMKTETKADFMNAMSGMSSDLNHEYTF